VRARVSVFAVLFAALFDALDLQPEAEVWTTMRRRQGCAPANYSAGLQLKVLNYSVMNNETLWGQAEACADRWLIKTCRLAARAK
jgi:hypothetical protein